ncbi:MAG: DUF4336 domain-containing protein [Myxococcota bacterium]
MPRLTAFAEDLWTVEGPTVSFFGAPYPTRAAVIRLPDGLFVWSPVAPDPELRAEIDALGPVRWLVEPNKIHHLFLGPSLEAWPEATAWAPPGLAARKPELPFAGTLGDTPEPAWADAIDQVVIGGSAAMDEVLFFHRKSSTVLVGDLVQRHDPAFYGPFWRAMMRVDALLGPNGSTPREWRASYLRRGPARAALDRALAWQPERLVIAHGACADRDAARILADSLAWIRRPWPL